MSYTYRFSFPITYFSDDPSTPVGGSANIELVFQADSLAEAQAQLSSALDVVTSSADVVNVTGIYQMPPG